MSTYANIPFPGHAGPRHPAPEDLVLYAMQLLNANESAAIAQHLASCPECTAELARVYSDLALTAATVDLEAPPESARQRLLQQVAREKKIVTLPQPKAQAAESHPPLASFGRSGSILSIDDAAENRPKRSVGRTILGVAGWAIAAGLAVAVSLQYKDRQSLRDTVLSQSALVQRLTADADNAHQLMDAITDPKAVRVSLSTKPLPKSTPVGGVTYNPDKGTLVFLASNLNPLQTYKTYELWVIPASGDAPIPAGTFHPDDQGNASVIMPNLPKGVAAKAFGVTIEADGGSLTPTSPIIMAGS
ncbi:MAG: anti-sigma factor [Acidobacteriota bacterium]|nr:anti-sigma factor [Acidobacteriota bacterium]